VQAMADMAKENARTSEEVSVAAQKQVNAIGQVTIASSALYETVERLKGLSERFRVQ